MNRLLWNILIINLYYWNVRWQQQWSTEWLMKMCRHHRHHHHHTAPIYSKQNTNRAIVFLFTNRDLRFLLLLLPMLLVFQHSISCHSKFPSLSPSLTHTITIQVGLQNDTPRAQSYYEIPNKNIQTHTNNEIRNDRLLASILNQYHKRKLFVIAIETTLYCSSTSSSSSNSSMTYIMYVYIWPPKFHLLGLPHSTIRQLCTIIQQYHVNM